MTPGRAFPPARCRPTFSRPQRPGAADKADPPIKFANSVTKFGNSPAKFADSPTKFDKFVFFAAQPYTES